MILDDSIQATTILQLIRQEKIVLSPRDMRLVRSARRGPYSTCVKPPVQHLFSGMELRRFSGGYVLSPVVNSRPESALTVSPGSPNWASPGTRITRLLRTIKTNIALGSVNNVVSVTLPLWHKETSRDY